MSAIIFDPNLYLKRIVVVGVGGTGSRVARVLARMLVDRAARGQTVPEVLLVDPDHVEAKNVGRQALFAPADIGRPKAECVGRRLNFALGTAMRWAVAPFDAAVHSNRYSGDVIVSCVDNHAARRAIAAAGGVHIGAGNHHQSGQVVIGNTREPALVLDADNWRADTTVRWLPTEALLFPDLLEPEAQPTPSPATVSCAEAVAAGDQHLLINDWVGTVVGGYLYKLLHRQPIPTYMTYIDAEIGTVIGKPISRASLESQLETT